MSIGLNSYIYVYRRQYIYVYRAQCVVFLQWVKDAAVGPHHIDMFSMHADMMATSAVFRDVMMGISYGLGGTDCG